MSRLRMILANCKRDFRAFIGMGTSRLLLRLSLLLPALVAFALDRASKDWVVEQTLTAWQGDSSQVFAQLFDIQFGEFGVAFSLSLNRGVAFGFLGHLGGDSQLPIIVLSLSIALLFAKFALDNRALLASIGASLIVGGAFGNLYDRFYYEGVVDFIDAYAYAYHWYKFNFADAAITCGVVLWLTSELCCSRRRSKIMPKK